MSILNRVMNFIFPPKCIFCGGLLATESEVNICGSCYEKIPFRTEGKSVYEVDSHSCGLLDGVICLCEYSGIVKHAIVRYKFYNKPSYYRAFAALLSDRVKKVTDVHKFDIIVSVPLHRTRIRSRGYNQSLLISRFISKKLGVPEVSECLSRTRDTGSQSLLSGEKRKTNVFNAFKVNHADRVAGRNVLLVDDVLTTGSTLNECCRALKAAGAGKVVAAVIASGRKF